MVLPQGLRTSCPPPAKAPCTHSLQVCSDVASSVGTPIVKTVKHCPACSIPTPLASPLLFFCEAAHPLTRDTICCLITSLVSALPSLCPPSRDLGGRTPQAPRECSFIAGAAAAPGVSPTNLGPFQRVSGSTLSKHCALAPRQAQEEE